MEYPSNNIDTRNRYKEFDILRVLPLLLTPIVHVFEEFEICEFLSEDAVASCGWVVTFCIIGPSIFMICFGANLFFAKEKTPKEYLKRGIRFLLVGIGLEIWRLVIPAFIFDTIAGRLDLFKRDIVIILISDIYYFVGGFLILFALFKKLRMSSFSMLITSMVMLLINTLIQSLSIEMSIASAMFFGNFFYTGYYSPFPLLSWTIFPIVGYCFGKLYRSFPEEKLRAFFNKRMFIFCAVFYLALFFTFKSYGLDPALIQLSEANDYITDYGNVLMLLCIAGMMISLVYTVYMRYPDSLFCKTMIRISPVIMPYYMIQWIIIGFLEQAMDAFSLPKGSIGVLGFYLISAAVTAITLFLSLRFGDKINKWIK